MLTIERLSGPFGSEITGLDLNTEPDSATFDKIVEALHRHAVICIRGQQSLTPEKHIAFSKRFGELEVHVQSSFNLDGYPEIYCITNCVDEKGDALGLAEAGRVAHGFIIYARAKSLFPIACTRSTSRRRWQPAWRYIVRELHHGLRGPS